MAAPGTVPCRAPFPTFLVHQRPEGAAEHGDAALLVEILQERKKAGGAIQGGRGLADGIAGREDERPLPGRLAEPGTGRDHSVIAFGEAAGRRDAEGAA